MTVSVDPVAMREWLGLLYYDTPGLVWVGAFEPKPAGRAFHDFDAVAYAEELDAAGVPGVYHRVTTLASAPLVGRGGVDASCALPGLWGDVDIAGPGHKHVACQADCVERHVHKLRPLPPDVASAMNIVAASGLPDPTLWVHSGGGLYPWWLFDEPLALDRNKAAVADVSVAWQQALAQGAAECGYHYGAGVGDLARVLRLPGTINRKAGGEALCRVMERGRSDERHPFDHLVSRVDAITAGLKAAKVATPAVNSPVTPAVVNVGDLSPLDAFEVVDWSDALLLGGLGWTELRRGPGGERRWRHPQATSAMSATTTMPGERDRLFVFSDNTLFPPSESITKGYAYALIHHGGDIAAAAADLAGRGYGSKREDRSSVERQAVAELVGKVEGGMVVEVESGEGKRASDVAELVYKMEVSREARKTVNAKEFLEAWREPLSYPDLEEDLANVGEPDPWRIKHLMRAGSNLIIVAGYKAGKTTLCGNLIRSLADDVPFLGRYDVVVPDGRVAVWNYEVARDQWLQWVADMDIVNKRKIVPYHLRGSHMPLIIPEVLNKLVDWLKAHEIETLIMDPFARAFSGCGDENKNSDVSEFLNAVDELKDKAGVRDLIMPVHTGRSVDGSDRARGATRINDWADAQWLVTKEDGERYLSAAGRDIDVPEQQLHYDPVTRLMRLEGWDRATVRLNRAKDAVLAALGAGSGLSRSELTRVASAGSEREAVERAINALQRSGEIVDIGTSRASRFVMAGSR